LIERLRIGSLSGKHDAFGIITDAAFDHRGQILIADYSSHSVSVFDSAGHYVLTLGRQGRGPGEFQSPGRIAVGPADSVFIWDSDLARISVFSPELQFVRSFSVSPSWLVNGIAFLPDGGLVLATIGRGERRPLRFVSRTGEVGAEFGPTLLQRDLKGYEASLLGGSVIGIGNLLAYSSKSPYGIWIMGWDGRTRKVCSGQPEWTTSPEKVVRVSGNRQTMQWSKYVHSGKLIAVNDSLLLNEIFDPITNRRVFDLISTSCALLRRTEVSVPLTILNTSGAQLISARTLEYPEVIIYDMRVRHASP
jgi:hypothetical protein